MGFSWALSALIFCLAVAQCLGQDCPAPQNETCDASVLACCDKNFRANLKFDSSVCEGNPVYTDPFCYRRAIENLYITDNILAVCDSYNLFKDCLGISMHSCMTYPWYLYHGYSTFIAHRNQILYSHLQFACGAGLQSFMSNDCFGQTWNNSRSALEQCRVNFDSDYAQGGCYAAGNLLSCVQRPFLACSNEAAWWMCEYSRVTSHIFFPQCRGSCITNTPVAK
uniref:Uncharacterized protein n=1 Tax=Panagrolaimus sp. JU765 TaxID=591449 RepID=A0AC34PUN6_9BILA